MGNRVWWWLESVIFFRLVALSAEGKGCSVVSMAPGVATAIRVGRQPSTSRSHLSRVALELFLEHGFNETTVDDIAAAAGIGHRTLFRYFTSKNDLPWGDFDAGLHDMRQFLADLPDDIPVAEALFAAIVDFNRFPAQEIPFHRERMKLLLNVPGLISHSTIRYAAWRSVVAQYVARRLRVEEDGIQPQAIAWVCLGASLSAYEQWLKHEDADLAQMLESAFVGLKALFGSSLAK